MNQYINHLSSPLNANVGRSIMTQREGYSSLSFGLQGVYTPQMRGTNVRLAGEPVKRRTDVVLPKA